jgi:hypothetical protein
LDEKRRQRLVLGLWQDKVVQRDGLETLEQLFVGHEREGIGI